MKIISLVLCLTMLTGCVHIRRHPVVTGIVVGAAVGLTVGILTNHHCKKVYDGKPYDGTYPCHYPEK